MPCYDPPPTAEDKARWLQDAHRRGDFAYVYREVPRRSLEQWLCDALNGRPAHSDALEWLKLHEKVADAKSG
jgi:hypothetical protein